VQKIELHLRGVYIFTMVYFQNSKGGCRWNCSFWTPRAWGLFAYASFKSLILTVLCMVLDQPLSFPYHLQLKWTGVFLLQFTLVRWLPISLFFQMHVVRQYLFICSTEQRWNSKVALLTNPTTRSKAQLTLMISCSIFQTSAPCKVSGSHTNIHVYIFDIVWLLYLNNELSNYFSFL